MTSPLLSDMYKDFLAIVRKSKVGTVIPEQFAIVLNQATEEVVTNKLASMEINKKVYDDLAPLRKSFKAAVASQDTDDNFTAYTCAINSSSGYRRIADVTVNLTATITNVKCHLLNSNEKTEVLKGYYSKPSVKKCYYLPIVVSSNPPVQKLKVYVPTISGVALTVSVNFDIYINPTPLTSADVVSVSKTSAFTKEMSTEIVNVAARMYIERVQDARFQSYNHDLTNKINN